MMDTTTSKTDLEQRVAALEKEVAELKEAARREAAEKSKDWRSTIGWAENDPEYDAAMRLARAWRKRQPKEGGPRAGAGHGPSERSRPRRQPRGQSSP